jgi:hypothetical protein
VKTGTPLFKIATQNAGIETVDEVLGQIVSGPFQNRFGLLSVSTTVEMSMSSSMQVVACNGSSG